MLSWKMSYVGSIHFKGTRIHILCAFERDLKWSGYEVEYWKNKLLNSSYIKSDASHMSLPHFHSSRITFVT
jgi:hypothetical protein